MDAPTLQSRRSTENLGSSQHQEIHLVALAKTIGEKITAKVVLVGTGLHGRLGISEVAANLALQSRVIFAILPT